MRSRWLVGCALAAGCLPTHYFDPSATGLEEQGSSGAAASTGSTGSVEPTSGTTESPPEDSTGAPAETTSEASTGESIGPPTIKKVTFSPAKPKAAGVVEVKVETEHADNVSMAGLTEAPIELVLDRPDLFVDAMSVAIVSSEANGEQHCGMFTPWRDGVPGATVEKCFTTELAAGGTETFWEGAPDKGTGMIAALAVLPDGHVVELGTYYPNGQPRCYVRRRDPGGAWGPEDFYDGFITDTCTANDMVVTPGGQIYLLASVTQNMDTRWWLGRMDGWKGETKKIGGGIAGASGKALAADAKGERVAVCGTYPTQGNDKVDAAVSIFADGQPGLNKQFDYVPEEKNEHSIEETPYDCLFSGSTLVLAGEAKGIHSKEFVSHTRTFLLEHGPMWPEGHFSVAGVETGVESGATALALDGDDNYVTGNACGIPCVKASELRVFSPGGTQVAQIALPANLLAPLDLAYSPAGYLVLASGTQPGQSLFAVQAWKVSPGASVWTYEHKGSPSAEIATAVTIGPYGQVYAGGISADGYPAIAYIAP